MKEIKNRLRLFLIASILGLIFLILGFITINFMVIGFGLVVAIISIINVYNLFKTIQNPDKMKKYLDTIHDERYKYINMRAYSATFWTVLYFEFFALSILSFLDFQFFAAAIGCTFSFKLITYLLFNIYFSKKY